MSKREKKKARDQRAKIDIRSDNQREYLDSILNNSVTFCSGLAGTGKTYLSVYGATQLLRREEIGKIVLCRPAVQSGEELGFLPGDIREKIDPYLMPLYDALHNFLGVQETRSHMGLGVIEIAPLAFMRGRTFDNAIMILDEAQNTTVEQMKLFLTRMGNESKMIINGDVTQVDLEKMEDSGLLDARQLFRDVEGIGWIDMNSKDIRRHRMVQKIVEAYEAREAARNM